MNWLEQVAPAMDPIGGAQGELHPFQGGLGNCGPSTGMFTDYMGTYNVLREVLSSAVEYRDFEEYIYLVSFTYLFSNS